jgi:Cu/Ag efflux protein CusF
MKAKRPFPVALAISLLVSAGAAIAQDAMVTGEVKKIDQSTGKISLKHGPIKKLDMEDEGMTMVFRVRDLSLLKGLKVGDKVKFDADRVDGQITVTRMQKTK